jgi:copper transport protein
MMPMTSGQPAARIAVAILALLMTPALLLAHQFLRDAAPADGQTLDAIPGEIRLTFSEPVRLEFTEVVVQGPEGTLRLGELRSLPDNPRVLVAPVEDGWHPGAFTLRWTTVGADGHRTDGTLFFAVREGAEGLPEPEPEPERADDEDPLAEPAPPHHDPALFPETPAFGPQSAGYVVVRALLFLALIAMLGAVALRWVVLPVAARQRPDDAATLHHGLDRGAARLGLVAAATLLIMAVARLWAQSASLFGPAGALEPERLGQALSLQPWALGWWLQAGGALVAVVGFALAARGMRAGWPLAVVATLVTAVTPALSGHAAGMAGLRWLSIPADALHVTAAGGWIGSLFAVLVVGIPAALRLADDRRRSAAAALVHAFSPTALLFVGVLVATGVVAAWLHLGTLPALWESAYGRTLLLKVALFAGVAAVGAFNFRRVRPTLADQGPATLRRSGTLELAVAVAVVVVTALLVAVPPPVD